MAHSFIKTNLLAGLLLCFTTQAAWSQNNYTYRMGNQRVEVGHSGLAGVSSSYITGGTLSHSAQVGAGIAGNGYLPNGSSTAAVAGAGITPGVSGNSNLPAARMGSTVGMPGDYMRSDLNPNFSYQQQPRQNVQYRNQIRYNQQQRGSNQPAAYEGYAHNTSQPTGRQAYKVPTVTTPQPAAQSSASSGTRASASGGGGSSQTSEYKGY